MSLNDLKESVSLTLKNLFELSCDYVDAAHGRERFANEIGEALDFSLKKEFGEAVSAEIFRPRDVPEYKGDADFILDVADNGAEDGEPAQDAVDYSMTWLKAEYPGWTFAPDPAMKIR